MVEVNKEGKVLQYSLKGILIKVWDSLMDVQRELGLYNSHISACCRGKRKTHGGFSWRYEKS